MNNEIELNYIKRIKEGETQLFSYFLSTYSNSVFRLISGIVHSKEDAEELCQDSFLKAFKKLDTYRGDCSFATWLYRIAYNTAISSTRKQRIIQPAIDESLINSVADGEVDDFLAVNDNEILLQKMELAIERLSPDDNAVITLFYLQNKSIHEIADITSLSVENIKVKLHRIRKKLYVMIKNDSTDE